MNSHQVIHLSKRWSSLTTASWKRKAALKKFPQQCIPYDGCTASAYVAYAWCDQAFIYPITPATGMGDAVANWASQGRRNLFGEICEVTQMQSEGGAAGALHGVLEVGTLCTTFTASQGLLLMIPNMYLIAGALNPCVFHVSARAIAKHALCIFGDHTDVMATRQTGFAMMSCANVQETMDLGLVCHMASLQTSVPFVNFFDGFRTSHEISKPQVIAYEAMKQLVPWEELNAFRKRGLNPMSPHSRGLGQFGDTYFTNLEATNIYYNKTPEIVQNAMNDVGHVTGRYAEIFEYYGHPEAKHVAICMGSGCNVVKEYIDVFNQQKIGLVSVKLYRPWDVKSFLSKLPRSIQTVSVLDRTKEAGSLGEPLFLDVAASLQREGAGVKVFGGRYGLGSREFTPGMVAAVFKNAGSTNPKSNFTVGVTDDVTFQSLEVGSEPDTCPPGTRQCLFWGMGSDGTVSANKNAIKLIGEQTDQHVQAYFAYDSKKAGGVTISHLRFGPHRIESSYAIMNADYVAVSETVWVNRFKDHLIEHIKIGGTLVLNSPAATAAECDEHLHADLRSAIAQKEVKLYTIDANHLARSIGLGRHTNNILSGVFFKLADIIPFEQAQELLTNSMRKAYAAKGDDVVNRNIKGLDQAIQNLNRIEYDRDAWLGATHQDIVDPNRPTFCTEIMDPCGDLKGEKLPVSAFDPRGHYPNATTQYEKRGIAFTIPMVDMDNCTQCNKCAAICPHAAIRPFLINQQEVDEAPLTFDMRKAKGGSETAGLMYRIQVAPEDCTGCEACSWACGDDALTMTPLKDVRAQEVIHWDFGIRLPNRGNLVDPTTFKGSQFQQPLLEFSGACEGCGETPYAKMVTQLFGKRMVIANASGCSSVWAGTASFSPLAVDEKGRGPAWSRSLFEDAAEFGFGMARANKQKRDVLAGKIEEAIFDPEIEPALPQELKEALCEWLEKKEDAEIADDLSSTIPKLLDANPSLMSIFPLLAVIRETSTVLPKISTWIWGGDGWAYDIGFGGLDHVLAGGADLNILVMDTEGYSNTGGQVSKATNLGAVQKFAPEGYRRAKKDLGALAMAYEDVYVASVSMGANYGQCVKSFVEAEAYPGTSLILTYSPCIEHKIIFPRGLSRLAEEMKKAVDSGYWTLYRYNPMRGMQGENAFQLDSKRLSISMTEFTNLENRFRTLHRSLPDVAESLENELQIWADRRHSQYKHREVVGQTTASGSMQLTILVGTDTGTTMELAMRTANSCRSRDFNVELMEMDEMGDISDLANKENVLLMCSTAGEGDMPASAHGFWEMLSSSENANDSLKHVNFCSFGLGDRGYRLFNKAIKDIDARFEELGANRQMITGLGDDQDDDKYETAFEEWIPQFWTTHMAPEPKDDHLIPAPHFELVHMGNEKWNYKQICPPKTKEITLVKNTRITPHDYDRIIYHLLFDVSGKDFSYLLGDALSVYPQNDPARVDRFLRDYKINPDAMFKVKPLITIDARRHSAYRRPLTIRQVFTEVVDILGRPSKHFYKGLARFAADYDEKVQLEKLISDTPEGKDAYAKLVSDTVTYADVLAMFPSAHPPLEHLMSMIPCIKPRLYSIASSQRFNYNAVELVIVVLDWKTPDGSTRTGLSTDYINRITTDKDPNTLCNSQFLPCGVVTGSFNFPDDKMSPMVMTGLGTGLAPFRAFIQEWVWYRTQGVKTGPMWLFYGCRHQAKDYIFGDELEQWHKDGVLTELRPAFSRDQKEKIYVQTRMSQVSQELYEDLLTKQGYFYLCGQAGALERDVESAIKKAIKAGSNCTEEEAQLVVEDMHNTGRYNLELY
eukprot:GEMP01000320.1.p1 GENE.GEMP01000320.1~~GEMP01000320.1.p1  ORF type:complete len:1805 (+),score=426.97 GEMP01000320.1:80-5494(+)